MGLYADPLYLLGLSQGLTLSLGLWAWRAIVRRVSK